MLVIYVFAVGNVNVFGSHTTKVSSNFGEHKFSYCKKIAHYGTNNKPYSQKDVIESNCSFYSCHVFPFT